MMARSTTRGRARILSVTTIVLGVLAIVWAVVTGNLVVDAAHITYFLPPPAEGEDPIRRVYVYRTVFWVLLVSVGAGVLGLIGVVVGIWGLFRRVPMWIPVVPVAALLLATAAPFLAHAVAGTVGTF